MHVIRVALFMLRSTKSKKSKAASLEAASIWKKFFGLGSMRPLHMQTDHQSPPRLMEDATPKPPPVLTTPVVEHVEVFTAPTSPAETSSYRGMSQYASATSLQELDEEDEEEIENYDDKEGDEMIDVKAEQFIAQFYEQMKLQNEAYIRRVIVNGGH